MYNGNTHVRAWGITSKVNCATIDFKYTLTIAAHAVWAFDKTISCKKYIDRVWSARIRHALIHANRLSLNDIGNRVNNGFWFAWVEILRLWLNCADEIFKCISLKDNQDNYILIPQKIVHNGSVSNKTALLGIVTWRRISNNLLISEPMMLSLLTHICVTRPRWVNVSFHTSYMSRQDIDEYLN